MSATSHFFLVAIKSLFKVTQSSSGKWLSVLLKGCKIMQRLTSDFRLYMILNFKVYLYNQIKFFKFVNVVFFYIKIRRFHGNVVLFLKENK